MKNELWMIILVSMLDEKTRIITPSISASEKKVKEWVKNNKRFLSDKNWIIAKYELAKYY